MTSASRYSAAQSLYCFWTAAVLLALAAAPVARAGDSQAPPARDRDVESIVKALRSVNPRLVRFNAQGQLTGITLVRVKDEWVPRDSDLELLATVPTLRDLSIAVDGELITSKGLRALRNATSLDKLVLQRRSNITDAEFAEICALSSLQELHASYLPIDDKCVVPIMRLQRLRMLYLSRTGISDKSLSWIRVLPDLEVLDISYTEITDVGTSKLAKMGKLRHLYMDDTRITGSSLQTLAALDSLQRLSIARTSIDDKSLEPLFRSRRLQWINLDRTAVTLDGVRRMQQNIRALTVHYDGGELGPPRGTGG